MDVTEAPPGNPVYRLGQDSDDVVMTGWAAPVSLTPDALDAAHALIVAQRKVIDERNAMVALLGHQAVLAEAERDAALETAARHKAAEDRLRERVARQRHTIERLRGQLALGRTGRVLAGIADAVSAPAAESQPQSPCACLSRTSGGEPVRGRWIPWARP